MTSKTSRWLDLIAFLLAHRFPVTREEIFDRVRGYRERGGATVAAAESARRKFERDKDELRAMGIAIETVPMPGAAGDEPASAYRLRPGDFYLPYLELVRARGAAPARAVERPYRQLARLELSDADLALLDRATRRIAQRAETALAEAAASARRKLEFDLPLPVAAVERARAAPVSEEGGKSLETLQRAVAERTAVRARYYAIGRDAEAERVIEPYGLFFSWSRWYCVARARDRDALRVFRVDRMREAAPLTGKAARFVPPADFSIRRFVHRAPWELAEARPESVRVRFGFPESRWVLAQGLGDPVEPLLDDGGAVLRFAVRDRNPFLRWLLTFRGQAQVLEPEAVADELRQLRQRVAALYAGGKR